MTTNIGNLDRMLRVAAGVIILLLGAFGPLGWWGLIGLAPVATALVRWCPAYTLLGVNTCGTKQGA
jgi:hypothetical protein